MARMARARNTDPDGDDGGKLPAPVSKKGRAGKIDGSLFDWDTSTYVDPNTSAVYDGGDQTARVIREAIASDWKMRQLSLLLTESIKGATWKLTPHKDDTGEAADTEEKLRRPHHEGGMRTPIRLVLAQATSSIVYGRAFFGKAYKLDRAANDGSVLYSDIAMRPASTCRIRRDPDDGKFLGFEQDIVYVSQRAQRHWDGRPIRFRPHEALVFLNGRDIDPVSGVSDLEVGVWAYQTKRKVWLLWLTFLDTLALPRTLLKHRGDETQAIAAARMIASLKGSGVGYYDGSAVDSIDTLDNKGASTGPFTEVMRYLDSAMAGSVAAGFTDLTSMASSGRGSYALNESAQGAFAQTREHAALDIADTFTAHCVAPLVRHNYGPDGKVPTFTFDALAGQDTQELTQLLIALATAQSTVLPMEFVNELAVQAARAMNLDVGKVETALKEHAAEAKKTAAAAGANPVGQQVAAVNGAVNGVQHIARALAGQAPPAPRAPRMVAGR